MIAKPVITYCKLRAFYHQNSIRTEPIFFFGRGWGRGDGGAVVYTAIVWSLILLEIGEETGLETSLDW